MDNTKNAGINKELKFDDAVIAKIVGITCNEVEGVYSLEGGMMANMTDLFRKDEDPTKGVDVDLSDDQNVSVSLDATVRTFPFWTMVTETASGCFTNDFAINEINSIITVCLSINYFLASANFCITPCFLNKERTVSVG